MNDLETRLQAALRDGVPDLDVPPALVATAMRRAHRVRRRRAAAGTAIGAAAVAVGVVAWPAEPPGGRGVAPVASENAPAVPGTARSVRLTQSCSSDGPAHAACELRVEFSQPDDTIAVQRVTDRWPASEARDTDPDRIDVTFSDGTTRSVKGRLSPSDESTWLFDIVIPPGTTVAEMAVVRPDRTTLLRWVDDD